MPSNIPIFTSAKNTASTWNWPVSYTHLLLLVSTMSSERIMPCAACEVQKLIGAVNAACFDLNGACTGFLLALNTAQAYLGQQIYRRALVIGSETLSHLTNWKDRSTCVLSVSYTHLFEYWFNCKKVFFSCDANAICCIVLMDFIIYDSVCTSRRKMALSTIFYSLFGKYSHTISSYTNYLLAALWIIFHLPVTD